MQGSSTRQRLLRSLHSCGYTTLELLLTPLQFDIPNSRLRYYMLAKIKPLSFQSIPDSTDRVWRAIPGSFSEWKDPQYATNDPCLESVRQLRDYLDADVEESEDYAIPDRVLEKWGRLFDIVTPSSRRTCCFTRGMD